MNPFRIITLGACILLCALFIISCQANPKIGGLSFTLPEGGKYEKTPNGLEINYPQGNSINLMITITTGPDAIKELNVLKNNFSDSSKLLLPQELYKKEYSTENVNIIGKSAELHVLKISSASPPDTYHAFTFVEDHDVLIAFNGAFSRESLDYFKDWLSTISEK